MKEQKYYKFIYTIRKDDPDNGEIVVKGLIHDVADFMGASDSTIRNSDKNGNAFMGCYYASKESIRKKDGEKKSPRQTKFEKEVDFIKRHLDIYGNTIMFKNPIKHLKALGEMGYLTTIKHNPKRVINYKSENAVINRETFDESWVIELIRKEK